MIESHTNTSRGGQKVNSLEEFTESLGTTMQAD